MFVNRENEYKKYGVSVIIRIKSSFAGEIQVLRVCGGTLG
jgi:hypothetical protein